MELPHHMGDTALSRCETLQGKENYIIVSLCILIYFCIFHFAFSLTFSKVYISSPPLLPVGRNMNFIPFLGFFQKYNQQIGVHEADTHLGSVAARITLRQGSQSFSDYLMGDYIFRVTQDAEIHSISYKRIEFLHINGKMGFYYFPLQTQTAEASAICLQNGEKAQVGLRS